MGCIWELHILAIPLVMKFHMAIRPSLQPTASWVPLLLKEQVRASLPESRIPSFSCRVRAVWRDAWVFLINAHLWIALVNRVYRNIGSSCGSINTWSLLTKEFQIHGHSLLQWCWSVLNAETFLVGGAGQLLIPNNAQGKFHPHQPANHRS